MVDFIGIENKLRRLDAEYNNNMQDPDLPVFYSKLAVLEFSGWLEDSIDDILFRYIDSHILDTKVRDEIRKSVRKITDSIIITIYSSYSLQYWELIIGKILKML